MSEEVIKEIKPAKKVIKWVLNILFFVVIGIAVLVLVLSFVTRGSNHGVPNYFGYQVMVVKSDSMAPTLKVGTAVIVKKNDISTLIPREVVDGEVVEEGDIVSYYVPTRGVVVTHRLIGIEKDSSDNYILVTQGENENSNQCDHTDGKVCNYPEERISEANYMGKVVADNGAIGWIYNNIIIVMVVLIGLPIIYLLISTIYDIVKNKDDDEEETKSSEEAK